MRRYRFDLDPVLRVRRIQQDAAQARAIAARAGYEGAGTVLDQAVERYQLVSTPAGPATTERWLAVHTGAELTAASVMAAGVAREVARTRMEDDLRALRDSRMRVTALERLDERRRDDHAIASRRAEEAEVDEVVTARHRLSQEATS